MNSKIVSIMVLLTVLHVKSHAQTGQQQALVKTGNEWKMPGDVFQRAKAYTADLREKLGLDSVQTKKVYEAFVNNTKPIDEISVAAVSEKEKAVLRKSNRDAFDKKLQSIFSVTQYNRYQQIIP